MTTFSNECPWYVYWIMTFTCKGIKIVFDDFNGDIYDVIEGVGD